MNILMFTWEYPPRIVGGLARHTEGLAEALVRGGDTVHIITADHPGTSEHDTINGVHIHRVKRYFSSRDFLGWIYDLNQAMIEYAEDLFRNIFVDIIHGHDWLVTDVVTYLKGKYKTPLIATIHATERGRWNGIHNETQSYIHSKEWYLTYESWRTIVCSNFMKKEVHDNYNLPYDKIDVIPNGIDRRKFDIDFDFLEFRRRYALDHEKLVMSVGRLVSEKGFHTLVDASGIVLSKFPDAKFVIAGKGPEMENLKNHIRSIGIPDGKFLLTGFIDDLSLIKLQKVSDVCVFPSLYEPFGIVALEGMASYTPVVVSDIGGFTEIIDHEYTGITTYTGNPESLAWGILRVLSDPEHARFMIDNALRKVIEIFNWDVIAQRTKSVYNYVRSQL